MPFIKLFATFKVQSSSGRNGGNPEKTMSTALNVLRIDASGRQDGSTSRALADAVIDRLRVSNSELRLTSRDLTTALPHVNEQWIYANFTDPTERDEKQRDALKQSDELVEEMRAADVIVIGTPIYNFSIPAALKAWVDMVARARLTFQYTENGPKGLLHGKKAYIAIASGGTEIDSAIDFATPYLRHVLSFLGIDDVEVVSAGQQMSRGESATEDALVQLDKLFNNAAATVHAAA